MPPNTKPDTSFKEYDFVEDDKSQPTVAAPWKPQLMWSNIIFFGYCYVAAVYGMYLFFFHAKWSSVVITLVFYIGGTLGITAGAHRYFSHRSYKATVPLQVFYMLLHCLAYQRSLVTWIRDHRLHHKYSDTDADPHNSNRGFFFSHIGWLLVKNHPEVEKRKKLVDMRDVYSNPVVMFQKRHRRWIGPLICFGIPTVIPWIFGENLSISWFINIFRYMVNSNLTFLTNSLAHSWGYKPYDKTIKACQNNPILFMTLGEGFHNYHHVFPWDYRTGESGGSRINFITMFIDFCGKFGWAYNMKIASDEVVKARMSRTGDGTDLWGRINSKKKIL